VIRKLLSVLITLIGAVSIVGPTWLPAVFAAAPLTPPPAITAIATGFATICAITSGGSLYCWGANDVGQLGDGTTTDRSTMSRVQGLTVTSVTVGDSHACAVTAAGGVKCWGSNGSGQLGDGTTIDRLTPVDVSGLTSGVVAVAAGSTHTCAVTSGGAVMCWGGGSDGQLGDGTLTDSAIPVAVSGLTSGTVSVTAQAQGDFSCVLSNTGGVKCWGWNLTGTLGDGTVTNRSTPVDVSGLTTGVMAVAAGTFHACAVMNTGGVKCWGSNFSGQVGDGTTALERRTPVDVSGLGSGVVSVAAGYNQSCALMNAGGVKCWGTNTFGQLGDGTFTIRYAPVDVIGLPGAIASVSAGGGCCNFGRHPTPPAYTCAVTSDGAPFCWGGNHRGQLGIGTVDLEIHSTPAPVVTVPAFRTQPANQVAIGGQPAAFVVAAVAATALQWQMSADGGTSWTDLSDGGVYSGVTSATLSLSNVPLSLDGHQYRCVATNELGSAASAAAALSVPAIGITAHPASQTALPGQNVIFTAGAGGIPTPTVQWQASTDDGASFTNLAEAPPYSGVTSPALTISNVTGSLHRTQYRLVATSSAGSVVSAAAKLNVAPVAVIALTAGGFHTCSVASDGWARCWGSNVDGQLGDGTLVDRAVPVDVTGLASGVAAMSAGGVHTCAVTSAGGVKCWGSNFHGSVGDGTATNRSTPVDVSGLTGGVTSVSSGDDNTCTVTGAGGVKCWGNVNSVGAIFTPTDIDGVTTGVVAVAPAPTHTCAITSAGGVKCWGANFFGQLGDGLPGGRSNPEDVSGLTSGVVSIVVGSNHTCALTISGGMKCWGNNQYGQLGDGTMTDRSTPVDVSGLTSGVVSIAAGFHHTCALTVSRGLTCWGDNASGQLGDGTTTSRSIPVDVAGLASGVASVTAGRIHTCALTDAGAALCWGSNVHGQLGDGTTTSRLTPAVVVTTATAPVITRQPVSHNVFAGQTTTFAVTAIGATTYQWQVSIDAGASWTNLSETSLYGGVTTATLIVTGAPALNGARYRCVVTSAMGSSTSAAATLTVSVASSRSPLDFDGDGKADLTYYRPSIGAWTTLQSSATFSTATTVSLGEQSDVLVPGDYDGDGIADHAVYRRTSGMWSVLTSSTGASTSIQWGLSGDVPFPGDYDGDGRTDPAVYRPSSREWFVLMSSTGAAAVIEWGLGGDVPAPSDYDGDGRADLAVYRPMTGMWFVQKFGTNVTTTFSLGAAADWPAQGDYDGDGRVDPAIYRPADQTWRWLSSRAGYAASSAIQWGLPGDVPVPADYDGDGAIDVAVYRPSSGTWYVLTSSSAFTAFFTAVSGTSTDVPLPAIAPMRPASDARRMSDVDGDALSDLTVFRPGNGTWYSLTSRTGYSVPAITQWGLPGDIPVAGDYDGDGLADRAVFRPQSGRWYVLTSSSHFAQFTNTQWGLPTDTPAPGDYDGDGITDPAFYRPAAGEWHWLSSRTGAAGGGVQWGLPGDVPVPGDYSGDGLTDQAVYRPQSGYWYILRSHSAFLATQIIQWGLPDDVPVPGDYDGDAMTDLAVFRPSTGEWYILTSSSSYTNFVVRQWGLPDDVAVPGDCDGDGRTDLVVFRPSTGVWFVRTSSSGYAASFTMQWGLPGDVPIGKR
jgi:alpha-tubulin suppressor-like RCC1 family protein